MKILIITTHPIQYNAPLFSYLAKYSNYEIKVFYTLGTEKDTLSDSGFGVSENWNIDLLSGYDYKFIQNTSYRPSSLHYFGIKNPFLLNQIKAYSPDCMIIFGWKFQSHFSVLKKYSGKIPLLFRGDSTSLDDSTFFSFYSAFRYRFLSYIYKKVDFVLSPGNASDQYFLKSGVTPGQLVRAKHAVDNDYFMTLHPFEQEELQKLKNSFCIRNDEVVLLFAGKFIEKKNPMLLIDAFEQLMYQQNHIRLFLVGGGLLEKKIKHRITQLDSSTASRITLLPFQDQPQMKLIYRLADVFILPSCGPGETWGLSVNEALACGTPVIVSDKCGCAYDLVKDGLNGFVFKSSRLDDLVEKLHLICNADTRKQLATKAVDSINEFSYRSFKNALDKVLLNSEA